MQVTASSRAWYITLGQHEVFAGNGCKVEKGRVLFPPGLVADALASVPDRRTLSAFIPRLGFAEPLGVKQGETHFGLVGNAYYIYDYDAGRSRDCIDTDIADKLLILDALPNFEYDCCNIFTASERGIGRPVVASYDTLDACTAFLRQWVCARAVSGRKKLPLGIRNCPEEETRLTVLGHAII